MTWLVPLALGGLAIAVMAVFTVLGAKKGHPATAGRTATSAPAPRILVHDINDDRCTGCDACVAVCPTNVLDLVGNKSRVLRFQDCIQCEACMFACPTEALVMFPEGGTPPALKVPELDESFQTKVIGQYLIGEVAGKPLVKNAANLGRAVVEHMLSTGLKPGALAGGVDVAIVGSGPGGLSAALTCVQRGLSYVLLEKEQLIASTISRYPKGKLVMAEPYDTTNVSLLPVFDSSKEQLLPVWSELLERVGIKTKLGEAVESIAKNGAMFDIRTTVAAYKAQRVVLATGTRGKPRTLQVPGENLPKVVNLLDDPDDHRGKAVLVIGGGDSAVEAALALADAGAKVTISYRGRAFNRAQPKNKQAIESYAAENRLKVKFQSQVITIEPDAVVLQLGDNSQKRYPNDAVFVLIGADPPVAWLEKLGVKFVERPHQYALGATDALVKRFLATAAQCPEDAARAAALVTGGPVDLDRAVAAVALPGGAPEPVSGPRKWLRSATGLFTGQKKLEQPMPLREFAKQQRFKSVHTGHGRRDSLSPGERTRVLRMLRDEGARLADEESYIGAMPRSESAIEMENSPPPEPKLQRTGKAMPPMHLEDEPPKQAVIVGLAKAMAAGPTTATRAKRPTQPPGTIIPMAPPVPGATPPGEPRRPGRGLPQPPVHAGPPTPPEVPMLPSRSKRPSAAPNAGGSPPPVKRRVPPAFNEEPTKRLEPGSPLAAMLRQAQAKPARAGFDDEATRTAPPHYDAESTRAVEVDAAFLDGASRDTQDELIDVGYLTGANAEGAIDLGQSEQSRRFERVMADDATAVADLDRLERLATLERSRRPAKPTGPRGGNPFEEPTRTVDASRPQTLSDVDWDLDS
ncbi:MAG: NAD(P)-binding domain-containing protein [Deltaproteobacteria bacterium]|nr:NAD(P)-binding domain-containing protein [Deltaproteobacteria bacterium]